MVLTVTLNPVADKIVGISNFKIGNVNRIEKENSLYHLKYN